MTYILFLIFFSFRSRTSVAMGAISPILPRPADLDVSLYLGARRDFDDHFAPYLPV